MDLYTKAYDSLVDPLSLYYDVTLLFDDGQRIYTSKYFLSFISPVLEKILKYDKYEDNIYKFPHKKSKIVQTVIALSFPFIDIIELLKLDLIKINPWMIKLIDEWGMKILLDKIENFFCEEYERYKINEIFFFMHTCNFTKVIDIIANNLSIKKYTAIKESKSWEELDNTVKITLSESVIDNIKKRKFNYYD